MTMTRFHRRAGPPVRAAHHPARGRWGRAAQAARRARAHRRRRRARLPGRAVPGCGRRRDDRARRPRRRRHHEPPAQILHGTSDVGRRKTDSGAEAHRATSTRTSTSSRSTNASTRPNALRVLEAYDVVVDGSDNFPTRYLLNDACYLTRKPLVSRRDLPVRGPADDLRCAPRRLAVLPVPVPQRRRRRGPSRTARRPACSARSPGRSAPSRRRRSIKLVCRASANRWSARCSCTMRWTPGSRGCESRGMNRARSAVPPLRSRSC